MDPELEKQLVGSFCVCYNVSYNEIAILVKNLKIKNMDELRRYVHICDRCSMCHEDIEKII